MDAALQFYTIAMKARYELQAQLADELAKQLVLAKRYQQAADILKKAVSEPIFPGGADGDRIKLDLYVWMVRALELGGKTQESLAAIHEAQKIDSDEPELHYWETWIYSHSHQWKEAIHRYEELIKKTRLKRSSSASASSRFPIVMSRRRN